jgi:hypothetical protein
MIDRDNTGADVGAIAASNTVAALVAVSLEAGKAIRIDSTSAAE